MQDHFNQRLKAAIADQSARQFALKVGVSPSAMVKYLSGENEPTRPVLQKISEATGVCLTWLVSGEGPMRPDTTTTYVDAPELTPILRYDIAASAGAGSVVDNENPKDTIAFRSDWLREAGLDPKQLNVISVMGDSMEPSLYDGDIILIDKRESRPRSGGVYVLNYDGNLLVKRLQPLLNGGFKIISDNPRYDPEVVDETQMERVRIIGRVVWKGGMMG